MKKTLIVAVLVLLGSLGYYAYQRDGGVASIVRSDNLIPTEYKKHESRYFWIKYPKEWFISDIQDSLNSYTQISNFDPNVLTQTPSPQGSYFKLEIVRLNNEEDQPLQTWVNTYIANQDYKTDILDGHKIIVDGHEGLYHIIKIVPVNSIHPIIFVKRDKSIYLLNISPSLQEFKQVFDIILESFKFKT